MYKNQNKHHGSSFRYHHVVNLPIAYKYQQTEIPNYVPENKDSQQDSLCNTRAVGHAVDKATHFGSVVSVEDIVSTHRRMWGNITLKGKGYRTISVRQPEMSHYFEDKNGSQFASREHNERVTDKRTEMRYRIFWRRKSF